MIQETFRKLWLKLRGRQPVLRGECIRCGQCCRGIHLKLGRNWLKSEKDFRHAIERNPHYAIFELIGRDPYGLLRFSCTRVGEDGLCTDYENRPSVCRKYPSSAMFYAGGVLIEGCGFRLSAGKAFDSVLNKEVRRRERGEGPVVDENA